MVPSRDHSLDPPPDQPSVPSSGSQSDPAQESRTARAPEARPPFSADEAEALVRERFGLRCRAEPLPADRDRNFRLDQVEGRGRWVLKVSRAGEDPALLECQDEVMERLAGAGLPYAFPRVQPDLSGIRAPAVRGPDGEEYLVRLVDWVPGTPLSEVRPHTPALLEELGRLMARVDEALAEYRHPAADRPFDWDLRRAGEVVDRLAPELSDPRRRAIVAHFRALFREQVQPRAPGLPTSVIHGDANDHNVLVEPCRQGGAPGGPGEPPAPDALRPFRIRGLVDFGDLVHSWRVGEVAVAAAYALLGPGSSTVADPLKAAARVVRGYHRILPLNEDEVEVLFPLLAMRLCVSVVQSNHRSRGRPDDAYLTISQAPAWSALERLERLDPALARYTLRDACGLDPCPATSRVVRWLEKASGRAGPVLGGRGAAGPDPSGSETEEWPVVVVDLSVEGADDQKPIPVAAEPGAPVRVGRHDEVRWRPRHEIESESDETASESDQPASESDQPASGSDETVRTPAESERASVHLGLDLFVPAGTPVLSPLAGWVVDLHVEDGRWSVLVRHGGEGGPDACGDAVAEGGGEPPAFHTLFRGLGPDSHAGQQLEIGGHVARGEPLGVVARAPGPCTAQAAHVHVQLVVDPVGLGAAFPSFAPPSRRRLWTALSPDSNLVLGLSGVAPAANGARVPTLLEARRRYLGPNLSVAYRRPLHVVRGWMQYLFDGDGQPYLDGVNNVAHVGHEHPRVVEALRRQAGILNTNTRYLHAEVVAYARRLVATFPEPLSVCFLVCSGSEANELALRMARAHTGRPAVLVLEGAYHGNTSTLVEMSPYKYKGPGGLGPGPSVVEAPLPDPYRGRYRWSGAGTTDAASSQGSAPSSDLGTRYAAHVGEALQEAYDRGHPVGAFFCEPLPGCAGQVVPPPGYLAEAFRLVQAAGAVAVADEVQTGFGRVGTHMWAFETQGALPDIVTLGKPMGNGHPVGAVVTTPQIAASFHGGMEYFNTFGGNPVSAAVASAVLDVLEAEGLPRRAIEVGGRLKRGLESLARSHPLVGDVRGLGLFVGVELVLDRETRTPAGAHAAYVVERMRDHGILLSTDGPDHNVIKIKPPMVFSAADADRLVETLDRVLDEDPGQVG